MSNMDLPDKKTETYNRVYQQLITSGKGVDTTVDTINPKTVMLIVRMAIDEYLGLCGEGKDGN